MLIAFPSPSRSPFRLAHFLLPLIALGLAAAFGPAPAARAQNLFAPVATVNDSVVTRYELDQRLRFMRLLRAPGDLRAEALKALINERLELAVAKRMGISLSDEQVKIGMEEFAKRAKLTREQFIAELAKGGVARETFRDFVRAGMVWREVVRARFGSRATVSDAEIDRAIAQASSSGGGLRVLLSEIILPTAPETATQTQDLVNRITKMTSISAFSDAARQFSASNSRDAGGQLKWMPLSNLPPRIRGQILALRPGKVTAPIVLPNAVALFQMRAIEETGAPQPKIASIDYASYLIAGGKSAIALKEAASIRARVDTCDDLYAINKGQPAARLERTSKPLAEIPKDVAIELAKLDDGEVSTQLTRDAGKTLVFLMLCARTPQLAADVSRADIRARLITQQLQSFADGYLAQLRADANIEIPGA